MITKDFPVLYKDAGTGSIEGYASTWIREPDSYGDVVAKGAFTKTLVDRWSGGKGIPFLWGHQMDNLKSFIGTANADEDDRGLHFVATFDDTEEAQKVRQLYRDGRLKSFSFAYDVKDAGEVTLEDGRKANELRELDLYEISAVMVPANDDAGVVDVKSGRRNSKADEDKIKQAISLLQSVIDTEDPEDGEDDSEANAAAEERKKSNPEKDGLLAYIKSIQEGDKTMSLKTDLADLKAKLAGLKDRIEANDQEAINEGIQLKADIETKTAEIEAAEKKAGLLNLIGKKEEETSMEEKKMPQTLGENFVEAVKAANIGKRFDVNAPAFKAATDTQTSPAGAVDFATTFDKNVVTGARTPLVIRNLFGAEQISGSTLVYLVEGAIQGAPAVTAEGAEKPQIHFADPTPKTVSLAKVACHIKESDEYINDYPFLASAINGRLLYELGLVEQGKLVTDLLGTSGIQTGTYAATGTATDIADAILQAAMDVQAQTGFAADAIAMNPADWYILRVGKDGDDRYYGGGYFGEQSVPNIWGIPVCVSASITSGTVVVGAFKTCASVVTNGGVSVEAVNTNEDDFVKNLMTIRAEERLALAVRRPAGFKKLTKAAT